MSYLLPGDTENNEIIVIFSIIYLLLYSYFEWAFIFIFSF